MRNLTIVTLSKDVAMLQQLRTMVQSLGEDYRLSGEAYDYGQAKELLKQQQTQVLVMDSEGSTSEEQFFLFWLSKNHPNTAVIVLAETKDFSVVKSYFSYSVADYVLKNELTTQMLHMSLRRAIMYLESHVNPMSLAERDHLATEQMYLGRQVMEEQFMLELLETGITSRKKLKETIKVLNLPIRLHDLMLVMGQIDHVMQWRKKKSASEWNLLYSKVIIMIREILKEEGNSVLVIQPDYTFTIVFSMTEMNSGNRFQNHVHEVVRMIRNSLKQYYNMTATYSVSSKFLNIEQIGEFYKKTRDILESKRYGDSDIILREQLASGREDNTYNISVQDEHMLGQMFRTNDRDSLFQYLRMLFREMRSKCLDQVRVQLIFLELLSLLNQNLREYGLDIAVIAPDFYQVYRYVHQMNLLEMQKYLEELFLKALDVTTSSTESEIQHAVTRHAVTYINRNFMNDVSLNDIAQSIGVTPSYMSRVFKEDIGKSAIEYLNWIRVEAAKKLICDGAKLNDLFRQVGFNSNTYFFTVFKQNTGKTPKQYRQYHIQNQ